MSLIAPNSTFILGLASSAKNKVEETYAYGLLSRRNTFVGALAEEMLDIFALADLDDRVRAVVLTAEANAPAYCSGVSGNNAHSLSSF